MLVKEQRNVTSAQVRMQKFASHESSRQLLPQCLCFHPHHKKSLTFGSSGPYLSEGCDMWQVLNIQRDVLGNRTALCFCA